MDPGRRIPNSARRTLRFVPAIALGDPDGFARERRAEPAATRHGGPFVRRVDEEVDGDRKRCGVPSEAPLRDSDGRSINDRDDVEVAAYAAIATRARPEVPDADDLRVQADGSPGPMLESGHDVIATGPYEHGRSPRISRA